MKTGRSLRLSRHLVTRSPCHLCHLMSDRIIYSGDAGTRFTNETGRVLYQFIAALNNTCGVCLQYHLKISAAAWPIPIHYNCRCIQRMIKPGQQAQHEFTDYRKLLDGDARARQGRGDRRQQLPAAEVRPGHRGKTS